MSGYMFPNGEKQLFITCQEGEWQVENAEWEVIPNCERKDEHRYFFVTFTFVFSLSHLRLWSSWMRCCVIWKIGTSFLEAGDWYVGHWYLSTTPHNNTS
jgi:hypothetical protein